MLYTAQTLLLQYEVDNLFMLLWRLLKELCSRFPWINRAQKNKVAAYKQLQNYVFKIPNTVQIQAIELNFTSCKVVIHCILKKFLEFSRGREKLKTSIARLQTANLYCLNLKRSIQELPIS